MVNTKKGPKKYIPSNVIGRTLQFTKRARLSFGDIETWCKNTHRKCYCHVSIPLMSNEGYAYNYVIAG